MARERGKPRTPQANQATAAWPEQPRPAGALAVGTRVQKKEQVPPTTSDGLLVTPSASLPGSQEPQSGWRRAGKKPSRPSREGSAH